jgi:glyoxylase-like metal-dependent hydrolase (beta-lactamase superfamily II)
MKNFFIIIVLLIQIIGSYAELPKYDAINKTNQKLIPVESVPNLFKWEDVCNVYILRHEDKALLIDLGDGSVLPHLPKIGINKIEWVLFTHHHREQCQGYNLLSEYNSKIGYPKAEKKIFQQPTSFRKSHPSNNDAYSVLGVSYVRPPIQSIPAEMEFSKMDTFSWQGYKFWCMETPGNSPGSMSYFLKINERWIVFSGDVILDGAKMHNFFDSEWDYGYGAGIRALYNSSAIIRDFRPYMLLPSHGNIIQNPEEQLKIYLKKLFNLENLLIRGYDVHTYSPAIQDMVSKPTDIPYLWQVSPHLFKFKGPNYFPNFSLILSNNGHALMIDCGLIDTTFLEKTLKSMKTYYKLTQIDALIITHIHGDHFLQAPFIKQKWNTPVWVLESMVPYLEHPLRYNYVALLPAYQSGIDSIYVDRTFSPGETFDWQNYKFTIDWMPGQTKYALCMHGDIDGKKVAFTGDNIFGDPNNPMHNGHEALVARNNTILEEGYIYAAEYLTRINPDILIGGHSFVMDNPKEMINRYKEWAYKMREAFQELSCETDYRYWYDPYWVQAEPYRTKMKKKETVEINIIIRNFLKKEGIYNFKIHTPAGFEANPNFIDNKIGSNSQFTISMKLSTSSDVNAGNYIIPIDVTRDGKRYGELFDLFVEVVK